MRHEGLKILECWSWRWWIHRIHINTILQTSLWSYNLAMSSFFIAFFAGALPKLPPCFWFAAIRSTTVADHLSGTARKRRCKNQGAEMPRYMVFFFVNPTVINVIAYKLNQSSRDNYSVGCTPNSVPMVFIVFSRDSWGLLSPINTHHIGLIYAYIGISRRGTLVGVHPTIPLKSSWTSALISHGTTLWPISRSFATR